ncbi:MAG: hypothetical protein HDR26_03355 [Lachnospiraceae bacterium]|nr:hypothetical protein [Lachnospiraceae bacterium]
MNCKSEISDGAAFCPKCGAKQDVSAKREEVSSGKIPAGKKKYYIGGGILCAVCIVGIMLAVLFFFRGRGEEPDLSGDDANPVTADEPQPSGDQDTSAAEEDAVLYSAVFHVYSCMDVRSDENGTAVGGTIPGAAVTVRESYGNYSGEAVCTTEAQDGVLEVELPPGTYTLQFQTGGYLDVYAEVEMAEEAVEQDVYMMPKLSESQTGILLTWDSAEVNLDLVLLTPWQTKRGDRVYIGRNANRDVYGNCLISDNTDRCEAMLVNSGEAGTYTLYVNNYTDSMNGNYASDALSRVNVHVFVYHADGLTAEYTVPLEQSGVIWEIAEISGSDITPKQQIYAEVGGLAWCMEDKGVWSENDDAMLLDVLQADHSDLKDLMELLVHDFDLSSDINMLLHGEAEGIEKFFGIGPYDYEFPSAQTLGYTRENSLKNPEELGLPYACYVPAEQATFLLQSICGRKIDFDFSVYEENWRDPYIGFGGWGGGDITRTDLEQFSVERIDADTWKVRAYNIYTWEGQPSVILNRVCFTVIRNPGSCFDDYSLTEFVVEEEADTSWMGAYYDYLTTDPEGIAFMDNMKEISSNTRNSWYNLIYVDDDMIPEIYLEGAGDWYNDILLFLSNGKVAYEVIGLTDGGIEYIPYTGILKGYVGMGSGLDITYKLENGSCVELANEGYESFILNGTEVTEEQYRQTIDSYIGNGQLRQCVPYSHSLDDDLVSWLKQEIVRPE